MALVTSFILCGISQTWVGHFNATCAKGRNRPPGGRLFGAFRWLALSVHRSLCPMKSFNPSVNGAVLAVYSQPQDKAKLRSIFLSSSWKLHEANCWPEAIALLRIFPTPVVICDADLPDGSWRKLIEHLALFRNPPRLIVASHHADDRLRAEALALGVHSILSMPFHNAEVCQAIAPAWREWNEGLSKPQTAVA